MIKLLCITFLIFPELISAQTPLLDWVHNFGSPGQDWAYSNTIDKDGNSYSTGSFGLTIDIDPGPNVFNLTNPNGSFYIQKLDPNGNFIWGIQISDSTSPGTPNAREICTDDFGNVFVIGDFIDTTDFDPGIGTSILIASASRNVFVSKYDSLGNFIWARSFEDSGVYQDYGYSIDTDGFGNVYLACSFRGAVDVDPGPGVNLLGASLHSTFIIKLNPAGIFLWAKRLVGGISPPTSYPRSIKIDSYGNVIVTGTFLGTIDFDPGTAIFNITGNGNVYILKLTASGNFIWAKANLSTSVLPVFSYGRDLTLDNYDNIIITGDFSDTVDFDPGIGNDFHIADGIDAFVQKLDSAGNLRWNKIFKGPDQENGNSVVVDNYGNSYVTGTFRDTCDFDPGLGTQQFVGSTSTFGSMFLVKLDSNGNHLWSRKIGDSNSFVLCPRLAIDSLTNLYFAGSFNNTVDFDPNIGVNLLSTTGGKDLFVLKLKQCIETADSISINSCTNYTSPSGKHTWTVTGNYLDTINNISGCDSIITINLTIKPVDVSTTSIGNNSITSNATAATFQWLDCNNNYAVITGETNALFIATVNGSYAVQVIQNGCIDTSSCVVLANVGINEVANGFGILVYPNPNTGEFTVEKPVKLNKAVEVKILDATSKMIIDKVLPIRKQKLSINIRGYSNGVYYLQMIVEGEVFVMPILKE